MRILAAGERGARRQAIRAILATILRAFHASTPSVRRRLRSGAVIRQLLDACKPAISPSRADSAALNSTIRPSRSETTRSKPAISPSRADSALMARRPVATARAKAGVAASKAALIRPSCLASPARASPRHQRSKISKLDTIQRESCGSVSSASSSVR